MPCFMREREGERRGEREMSNHHRFRMSHLMPNSWFYKLRDMKRPRQTRASAARTSKRSSGHGCHGAATPRPLPLSPRQSYSSYLQTKKIPMEVLHLSPLRLNPKAAGIRFPKDHQPSSLTSRSSTAAAAVDDDELFQDLRLRPIRTRRRPPASAESGTCPSSPRLRSRRLRVLSSGCGTTGATTAGRRRSAAARSFAVAMASTDPRRDFRESMVEMIAENDMRADDDLEDLLGCYLALNSREYHGVIMEVFMEIWLQVTDGTVDI